MIPEQNLLHDHVPKVDKILDKITFVKNYNVSNNVRRNKTVKKNRNLPI